MQKIGQAVTVFKECYIPSIFSDKAEKMASFTICLYPHANGIVALKRILPETVLIIKGNLYAIALIRELCGIEERMSILCARVGRQRHTHAIHSVARTIEHLSADGTIVLCKADSQLVVVAGQLSFAIGKGLHAIFIIYAWFTALVIVRISGTGALDCIDGIELRFAHLAPRHAERGGSRAHLMGFPREVTPILIDALAGHQGGDGGSATDSGGRDGGRAHERRNIVATVEHDAVLVADARGFDTL